MAPAQVPLGDVFLVGGTHSEILSRLLEAVYALAAVVEQSLVDARTFLATAEATVTSRMGTVLTLAELLRDRFQDPAAQTTPASEASRYLEAAPIMFET